MTTGDQAFLSWLAEWVADLPEMSLHDVVADPASVTFLSVDLVKGFCCEGPLASPRVAGIIPAAVDLRERAYALGVRNFLLSQDTHDSDALEFSVYAPHAMAGTSESETVDELKALPFADEYVIIEKNSISTSIGTTLVPWLESHPEVRTFIVVGDCTDLCVYQAAMDLRLRANVAGWQDCRVIVPANCVQTYDIPVETAAKVGIMPHNGDLLHQVFLYTMALNGIEVVARLN